MCHCQCSERRAYVQVEKTVKKERPNLSSTQSIYRYYVSAGNRQFVFCRTFCILQSIFFFAEYFVLCRVFTGTMSPVATEERRMLPLGGGLKRSASFVISVDEVEVLPLLSATFNFLAFVGTFWGFLFLLSACWSFFLLSFLLLLVIFGS